MPNANMGQKTTLDRGGQFLELNKIGKITVRFVRGDYYYDGKHFQQDEETGKWVVTPCRRINEDQQCDICERYFEIVRQKKEAKTDDEKAIIDKKAKPFKPTISFYYPVIDRETQKGAILKVTLSTRLKLEEKIEQGLDVLKYDWIYARTERPGNDYYTIERVDSAETKELTDFEKKEIERLKEFDISEYVDGKSGSMDLGENSEEAPIEDIIIPDDLPFGDEPKK